MKRRKQLLIGFALMVLATCLLTLAPKSVTDNKAGAYGVLYVIASFTIYGFGVYKVLTAKYNP